jgi:hypothetical protein
MLDLNGEKVYWLISYDMSPIAQKLADRHYSRRHPGSRKESRTEEPDAMRLVSVTAEYLPVATSIGDFYLHKNDILYLPQKAAELITEKKYARYVILKK